MCLLHGGYNSGYQSVSRPPCSSSHSLSRSPGSGRCRLTSFSHVCEKQIQVTSKKTWEAPPGSDDYPPRRPAPLGTLALCAGPGGRYRSDKVNPGVASVRAGGAKDTPSAWRPRPAPLPPAPQPLSCSNAVPLDVGAWVGSCCLQYLRPVRVRREQPPTGECPPSTGLAATAMQRRLLTSTKPAPPLAPLRLRHPPRRLHHDNAGPGE